MKLTRRIQIPDETVYPGKKRNPFFSLPAIGKIVGRLGYVALVAKIILMGPAQDFQYFNLFFHSGFPYFLYIKDEEIKMSLLILMDDLQLI